MTKLSPGNRNGLCRKRHTLANQLSKHGIQAARISNCVTLASRDYLQPGILRAVIIGIPPCRLRIMLTISNPDRIVAALAVDLKPSIDWIRRLTRGHRARCGDRPFAQRSDISPRYVRKLFQDEPTTSSDFVLSLRLERSQQLLRSPARAIRPSHQSRTPAASTTCLISTGRSGADAASYRGVFTMGVNQLVDVIVIPMIRSARQ